MVCKKQLPCHTTSQQRLPVGVPGGKKASKRFQRSPVTPPNSCKATINTTKRSKRMLPRVTSVAQDFVFTTSTKSPGHVVTSDSEESSDDYSRHCDARIAAYSRGDESRQESYTMASPQSFIKAELLSASSDNSETNPFSMASLANNGSSFSFRARETELVTLKRRCRSLDSSPIVSTKSGGSSPATLSSPPRDSSPMNMTAHRMVDYSESNASTVQGVDRAGATRRKSKIIKLNQPKGTCTCILCVSVSLFPSKHECTLYTCTY